MTSDLEVDDDDEEACIPVSEVLLYLHHAARVGTFVAIIAAFVGFVVGFNLDALLESRP